MFALGLSVTVAPLTATVLADADESDAGIASAINNAIARVAGLVGVSVIGVVVAGTLVGDTFAREPRVGPRVPRGDGDLRRARRGGRRHRPDRDRQPAPDGRGPRRAPAASSPARRAGSPP